MPVSHPIEEEEIFKEVISSRKVNYTYHLEEKRLPIRENVSKDLIERHLDNPSDLIDYSYEEDNHKREKYQLVFDKSTKYFLKIVLSMAEEELFIVTAHVVNKTRKELSQVLN